MASNDTLLQFGAQALVPPSSNAASFDTRNDHPVLDFAVGDEALIDVLLPEHYAGGGLTIDVVYAMSSATTGNVQWQTEIDRIGDGQQDLDADSYAAAQTSGDVAVPATAGETDVATITHTDGAQIDSAVAGETVRVRVKRVAAGSSEASGDAELLVVHVKET